MLARNSMENKKCISNISKIAIPKIVWPSLFFKRLLAKDCF
jgi:hypothetical protein